MLMYTQNLVDIFSSSTTQSSEDSLLDKEHDQGSVRDTSFQRGGQENRNQEQAQFMQLQCVHSKLIATYPFPSELPPCSWIGGMGPGDTSLSLVWVPGWIVPSLSPFLQLFQHDGLTSPSGSWENGVG